MVYTTGKVLTKWNYYCSKLNTRGELISYVNKFFFIFNISSGFLCQFQACTIHHFHAYFSFIFIRLKLTSNSFSLETNYYFVIESKRFPMLRMLLFIKLFWYSCKLDYKVFPVNAVSIHLPATWQFWRYELSFSGRGVSPSGG